MAFLSVLLSAFCLITRKSLLRAIFGAVEADVMRNSQVYFFFTLLSFPFIGLYDAGASIMRAQNNSRNPMVISVISNFMNIGGNAILIFGFGMGVEGAAISTLVSRIFCAIVVIIQLRRENEPIFIKNYMSIRPEWGLIKKSCSSVSHQESKTACSSLESWLSSRLYPLLEPWPSLPRP